MGGNLYHDFMNWAMSLGRQDWMIVLIIGCLLGFLCMRGIGGRSQ